MSGPVPLRFGCFSSFLICGSLTNFCFQLPDSLGCVFAARHAIKIDQTLVCCVEVVVLGYWLCMLIIGCIEAFVGIEEWPPVQCYIQSLWANIRCYLRINVAACTVLMMQRCHKEGLLLMPLMVATKRCLHLHTIISFHSLLVELSGYKPWAPATGWVQWP